jgi:hypothetical protein
MGDDYGVDLGEVFEIIDAAEVLIVRFHLIRRRLLIDFRARPGQPPIIKLVPPAESIEERFRSIKQLRPDFAVPEKVMTFHWPRTAGVLEECGVWGKIADRMTNIGGERSREECQGALRELRGAERQEVASAIRGGDHYQTLWERQGA